MKRLTLLLISLLSLNAYAFKMTPMISTIEYGKGKKNTLGVIINESYLPIAIQLTAFKRDIDKNGVETKVEELDDINIYPPQLVVPPKSKRTFKVTYTGKDLNDVEKAYRILAEESPVDLNPIKTDSSNIKFKVSYLSALYVSPKNAKSNIVIKSLSREGKRLKLVVENLGSRHQNLTKLSLEFLRDENDKNSIKLEAKDLKGISSENILAKSERIFFLDKADLLGKVNSSYLVRFNFDKD